MSKEAVEQVAKLLEQAARSLRQAQKLAEANDIPLSLGKLIQGIPTREQWHEMDESEQRDFMQRNGWNYSDGCTGYWYDDIFNRG